MNSVITVWNIFTDAVDAVDAGYKRYKRADASHYQFCSEANVFMYSVPTFSTTRALFPMTLRNQRNSYY